MRGRAQTVFKTQSQKLLQGIERQKGNEELEAKANWLRSIAYDHVEMGNLTELLSKIQPAVYEENRTQDPATRNSKNPAFVENVAELNVRRSVRTIINRSYILEQLIAEGQVAIVGAKHDLSSGAVTFFDDTYLSDRPSLEAFVKTAVPSAPKAVKRVS